MPKISVIVPVYKAEAYLRRCVDSLLAQTFQDFELLLVDDGSPDRSGGICDEYARRDARVRVFHKENGGVSSARQCGLDNALGDYTIHADPDDWVELDMLETLYAKATEETHVADIVICDYTIHTAKGKTIYKQANPPQHGIQCMEDVLNSKLHASLWNKLIRKKLYTTNDIHFTKDLNMREDLSVVYRLFFFAKVISYVPRSFYNYIVGRTGSYVTSGITKGTLVSTHLLIIQMKDFLEKNTVGDHTEKAFKHFFASSLSDIMLYGNLNDFKHYQHDYQNVALKDISSHPTLPIHYKIAGSLYLLKCKPLLLLFRKLTRLLKRL